MKYTVLMSIYFNDNHLFLREAIDDILAQTIPPSEYVIVLDGPINSECIKILDTYEANELFKIVKLTNNIGLGLALNEGLKYCSNELILRMDADDKCSPVRAERLLEHISAWPVDVVGSYIKEFKSSIKDTEGLIKYDAKPEKSKIFNYLRDPIGHASVLFRKQSVINAGGYQDCLYFEDTYLWLRMNRMGCSFSTIPESLYYARVNGFANRRGGFRYLKIEANHFWKFYKEDLISLFSLIINATFRPPIRLLNTQLLSLFYKKFLRS